MPALLPMLGSSNSLLPARMNNQPKKRGELKSVGI